MVYLSNVGDGRAVDWAGSADSVSSVRAYDNRVVWAREECLRWAWDEGLCAPQVLAMIAR